MRILVALALVPLLPTTFRLAPTPPAKGEEKVSPGQLVPDFEFRTVLGGDGRTKLSEFRGQPVLIAWYSTVFAGMDGARIAADLDQETNGDLPDSRLVVFLMEIKNHDATYLRALQMAQLPGARCRLLRNQELHVTNDASTGFPPNMILIGADGKLLYSGSYQSANVVKKLLKEELGKLEKGWGADPLVRNARALAWGEGKLGEARELLEHAPAEPASDDVRAELGQLATELEARFAMLERAIGHHREQGEPRRATLAADRLALAAAGRPAWSERGKAAVPPAESAREAELEKKLDSILKPTLKAKPKKGLDEKLLDFAKGEANGSKVGARATRLADAVAKSLGEL